MWKAESNIQESSQGGELLQYAEQLDQSLEVQEEVENTNIAIIRGLLPWSFITPANEIEKLMQMREPANDDGEQHREAA